MVYEEHEKPRLCEKTTEVIVYVYIGNIASESICLVTVQLERNSKRRLLESNRRNHLL